MDSARKFMKLGFLDPKKTVFLACDIQEIFRKTIEHFDVMVKVANKMATASRTLGINMYVSEQYPEGLGGTTKDFDTSNAVLLYGKTLFSMVTPELLDCWKKTAPDGVSSAVIFGIETHVCVEQTAMDLLEKDIAVHIVADGCLSRSQLDRVLALQRLQTMGCFVTTSENVLFKLLRDKSNPHFKAISKLIKDPIVDTLRLTGTVPAKL